ncbi:MAG: DUF4493 domain-containing protein [Bacteroidales bacterium]|nr:DUF4493 domain-containing protein [Bacteroidales bacterium]
MRKLLPKAFAAALLILSASCTRESFSDSPTQEGQLRISLRTQDIIISKAGAEDSPSADDFEIEIYNQKAIRLYRKPYSEAKDETIKLNAGEYRLIAHHGDTLGAGFGKAYYLADEPFTVHGFVDNGRKPDVVEATATLGNVKAAVNFGENLTKFYSDFYAVLRHSSYPTKKVRFSKAETRAGYIPAGELYLEVFAELGGTGMQDGGENKTVYFKTDPVEYSPADFVTFNVETSPREGDLTVSISIDRSVETVEFTNEISREALPAEIPVFSHKGSHSGTYSYTYPSGASGLVQDAVLSASISDASSWSSITVSAQSDYLTLGETELVGISASDAENLRSLGLDWLIKDGYPLTYVDFSGVPETLSAAGAKISADGKPVATFTVTVTDSFGNSSSADFSLVPEAVGGTVSVKDYNIWGWKMVSPEATLDLPLDKNAKVSLQWSEDGSSWSTVESVSGSGKNFTFGDAAPLSAGKTYRLRTMINDDPLNVSEPTLIATEAPQQVGNNDFESFTEQTFTTEVKLLISYSPFEVTWWQLYKDDPWWAVNSPVTLNSECTPAYQDFKTFPTVSLISSGAYSGNSAMIASIAINDLASKILNGDTHGGELFIGSANNLNEGSWAKSGEGHAFSSRPSALTFKYKFDSSGNTPFYVSVSVLAQDGTLLASSTVNNNSASVSSWTEYSIPLNYSVTDKKAGMIKMSFKSSENGNESSREKTITTLSGEHEIHAGNILYIDDIILKYE